MKAVPELFRWNRQGMTQHGRLSPHIGTGSAIFRAWPPRITFTIWHRGLGDDPATWNWISWVGFEMKLLVQNWPSPVFLSQYPHLDMSQSPWKPMRWTSAKVAKPEKWLDQYILFWQWFPADFSATSTKESLHPEGGNPTVTWQNFWQNPEWMDEDKKLCWLVVWNIRKVGLLTYQNCCFMGFNGWLVVTGTWMDYDFPFTWECHHPNWSEHSMIFQRGGEKPQPPTS